MKKGTFGGTPAADSLDAIMCEINDDKMTNKVGRIICKFKEGLKRIGDIQDVATHSLVLNLFTNHHFNLYPKNTSFPPAVKSHLNNYLKALIRMEREAKRLMIKHKDKQTNHNLSYKEVLLLGRQPCQSQKDGDCNWAECPQIQPTASGRHCPLDWNHDDDYL